MVGNKGIRKSQNITWVSMIRGMRWHAYTHINVNTQTPTKQTLVKIQNRLKP